MKKMFLLFSIFIFSLLLNPLFAMSDQTSSLDRLSKSAQKIKDKFKDQTKFQKFVAKLSVASDKFSNASEKINTAFSWVADRIDTILTKKGAIKILLILGPLFATYCYFFPPAPVQALINKIVGFTTEGGTNVAQATLEGLRNNKEDIKALVTDIMQEVGDIQATVKINQEIGEMQAFFNSMYKHFGWTSLLGVCKAVEKGIVAGIPFALGILFQSRYGLKR